MTEKPQFDQLITYAQAAELLGIEPRRIKQLVRDRILFSVKTEQGLAIPRVIITESEYGWEPLWNLPGTLTLLADAGFNAEEAAAWLYRTNDELGQTPLEALLAGHHHRVNRIATTLAF